MLPKGPLGRQQIRKLHVYRGQEHPHQGQAPTAVDLAAHNRKNSVRGVCQWLRMLPGHSPISGISRRPPRPSPRSRRRRRRSMRWVGRTPRAGARRRWHACGSSQAAGGPRSTGASRDLFQATGAAHAINQPFEAAHRAQQFDLTCTVAGGGLSGQAGAVRHGISRALVAYDPMLRPPSRPAGSSPRLAQGRA